MAAKLDTSTGEEQVNHFKAIPWCAKHLAAPNLAIIPGFCRALKPRVEDALLSQTLRKHDAIPAYVLFFPRPQDETAPLPEVKALVTLGNMISTYSGISHGGIVATVLDESLSFIIAGSKLQAHQSGAPGGLTAHLNTRFLRPVAVPGTYLITARLAKVEGRKTFVEGYMETENGQKVAEADALFIALRPKL